MLNDRGGDPLQACEADHRLRERTRRFDEKQMGRSTERIVEGDACERQVPQLRSNPRPDIRV